MNPFKVALDKCLKHSKLSFCAFVVLGICVSFGITKVRLELDLYDVLDENFPSSVRLFEMRNEFEDMNSIHLIFRPLRQPLQSGDICKILKFVRHTANEDIGIESWFSPWKIRKPVQVKNALWYPVLLKDPCETSPETFIKTELEKIEQTPWNLLLTDPEHNEFSIFVSFKDEDLSGRKHFNPKKIEFFDTSLKAFLKNEKLSNISYEIQGQAAFRWHFQKILAKDSVFNLAIIVLFICFFRIFFGTWKSGLLYIATFLYSIVSLYGFLSWCGLPIDILTNNLFLMTAIAGVADFLFLSASQEEMSWKESYQQIITPGFFTTFTTVVGFWSLMTSEVSTIQRFGFAAGCGALIEWVATFLILPVALDVFKFQGSWVNPQNAWRPRWIEALLDLRPSRSMTLVICGTLVMSFWAAFRLNFSDHPTKNFPTDHPLRIAFENLVKSRGWESSIYIVFPPTTSPERQLQVLEELKGAEEVRGLDSSSGVRGFLTNGFEKVRQDLIEREFVSTVANKRYTSDSGVNRAMLLLRSSSLDDLHSISKKIKIACGDECSAVGQNEVFREYSSKVATTLLESFLVSIVIVLCTLFILAWYLGVGNYLSLAISILWGPLMMIIFLGLFRVPINLISSMFLAVIVGMTGDNAIQYLYGDKNLLLGAEKRGRASFLLSILLCLGSLMFLFQTLTPMKWLGVLFFLGFFVMLFGDLWVLKGLLNFNYRAKISTGPATSGVPNEK